MNTYNPLRQAEVSADAAERAIDAGDAASARFMVRSARADLRAAVMQHRISVVHGPEPVQFENLRARLTALSKRVK